MTTFKLVGVGGIINQMLPTLIAAYPDAKLLLYDGDVYESRNLGRQTFAQVGGNKAIVTASALKDQGIDAVGIPSFLSPTNCHEYIVAGDVILAGVDNFRTRNLLNAHCMTLQDVLLISGGNELIDGSAQVLWRENGVCITPPLTYGHPEIEFPKDKAPWQRGCLELWHSKPQLAETNHAVGEAMLEAYADIATGHPVSEIYVSVSPVLQIRKVLPEMRGWLAA
jgi:molybdopterin/thiamine biosynthesis adenylyltransferase